MYGANLVAGEGASLHCPLPAAREAKPPDCPLTHMYDLKQFRLALYILLAMGMSGFAIAAESPEMWVLFMAALGLNAWMVKTGRFVPLPRIIANLIALGLISFFALRIMSHSASEILIIGQFLVFMQLVKLYEQRANRDYAQLLVLSLLLMVASAISTASLLYGVLLIAYLFLSLYCCLLFHLKVETDAAKSIIASADTPLSPETLRHDQKFLARSMRRLTGLVSSVSLTSAIIVFLFFPRGTGAGMFGQLQFRPAQTLTGFSETVQFEKVARIALNEEIVAHVSVTRNSVPVSGTELLMLRGMTFDDYTGLGDKATGIPMWQWRRSPMEPPPEPEPVPPASDRTLSDQANIRGDDWEQTITLKPTGSTVLFAMAGPTKINFGSTNFIKDGVRMSYSPRDEVIQLAETLQAPLQYTVNSTGVVGPRGRPGFGFFDIDQYYITPHIDPKIREYAMRAEVSGEDENGPLAPRRGAFPGGPLDEQIARNIEHHLQTKFSYTLDLTDTRRVEGQDPLVAFLYDFKRGHCEYFAGAMALMCQSLSIPARVVIGFKCDEYNPILHQYTVKQSHAHAWVEVLTGHGWMTFDPTSNHESTAVRAQTVFGKAKQFFDYLDYTWANSVVAYDRDRRDNLVQNVETRMINSGGSGAMWLHQFNKWLDSAQFFNLSAKVIVVLLSIMSIVLVALVLMFLYERVKLRRRAARIGLDALPATDQLRLARQLGFYDELIQLLEKHRITRPRHQTPLEFSNSLSFLPTEAYDAVRRLTHIFYRIRYGQQEIDERQQKRLSKVIGQMERGLPDSKTK
jgi:protein-glutamine gamma-glutamyltransferase